MAYGDEPRTWLDVCDWWLGNLRSWRRRRGGHWERWRMHSGRCGYEWYRGPACTRAGNGSRGPCEDHGPRPEGAP